MLAQLGGRTATTQRRVRFEEDPPPALEPATLGRRKRKASSAYGEYFEQMESSDDEDAEIEEPIMAKKSKRNAPKALANEYFVQYETSDDDGGDYDDDMSD